MNILLVLFTINAVSLILRSISLLGTNSTSVFIDLLNDLGDSVGLGLLILGLKLEKTKSITYPYGRKRSLYVLSLISITIFSGILFATAISKLINTITGNFHLEVSYLSRYTFTIAFLLNSTGLLLLYSNIRKETDNPNPLITTSILDTTSDTMGSLIALIAITTGNIMVDLSGGVIVSVIMVVSAITIGYRYFEVLVGRAPPKETMKKILEKTVEVGEVKDVNVFNAIVLTEEEYFLAIEVEVDRDMDVEKIEKLSSRIEGEIRKIEPRFKHIVVEFVSERNEPKTYKKILHEIMNSKK